MRRLLVLAMALATTLTAAGCSDSTGPGDSLAGTYSLRTVNNTQVPVTVISGGGYSLEVLSGSIALDAQGNYTGTVRYRETDVGQAPVQYDDTIYGYWTLSGNTLTLTDSQTGDQYFGTVSGSTITLSDGSGYTEVYTK
jgi:uncharacterized lipoprotein NlpE involved in copper resistance